MKKSHRLPLFGFLAAGAAFVVLWLGARGSGLALPGTGTKVMVLVGLAVLLIPAAWFWLAALREPERALPLAVEPPPKPLRPRPESGVFSVDLSHRGRPDDDADPP